jgi:hypothetical protein
MRKYNEISVDSGIYARIREVQMGEHDRRAALDALRHAEQIAQAILWIKEKFAAFGGLFLKPSLKH